ncbi:MAG: phosphohistidine phosphatase SixA [Oscillatoria sp. PMC 1051.18]|nr:phosphohistidine phosphatase SixA [Oscillatoria sp. PMC 1050.18]MEC5031055.1 phosphohistidine phosphatase SixA [Oscillatoria sp. PMC 1051.18]
MEIYLIRHGIAADRGSYDRDEDRPLTDKGRQRTTKVALRLHEIGLRFETILTSPLVRAQQTAKILQNVGLGTNVVEFPALAPDGEVRALVNWLEENQSDTHEVHQRSHRLALVGHQPDLGNWAEILVWGKTEEKLVVKKAGIIGLQVPQTEPLGNSELFLLTSPKWLI